MCSSSSTALPQYTPHNCSVSKHFRTPLTALALHTRGSSLSTLSVYAQHFMLHELASKKVERWDKPKISSRSTCLSALLQICAFWPCLYFKSLQANISWEEKQMVQLNTKILHHGVPCQISQTFQGWLNGGGWSKQALCCLDAVWEIGWRTISKGANSFLKADDLRVLENQGRRAQNAHTEPYRVSEWQSQTSAFLCALLSHSSGKKLSQTAPEVIWWRALREKRWLGCCSTLHAGTKPDGIPSLWTSQGTHRDALEKAASSHPTTTLASTLREPWGPLKCCRRDARGARTQARWERRVLSTDREASSPRSSRWAWLASGGVSWLHWWDGSRGAHSGVVLNWSAFFKRPPCRLPNIIFNISYIDGSDIHLQLVPAASGLKHTTHCFPRNVWTWLKNPRNNQLKPW